MERFGRPRRTRIISPDEVDDVSLEAMLEDPDVTDEPCAITLSASGVVGREPADGARQATFGRHDVLRARVATTTMRPVWTITSRGRCLQAPAASIGEVSGRSRGMAQSEVFTTEKGEELLTLVAPPPPQPVHDDLLSDAAADAPPPIMLVTELGIVKRVTVEEITGTANGKTLINLKPGDRVVAAFPAPDGVDVILVASNAQGMRCEAAAVPVQGRGAAGVTGMKLADGARVVSAGPVTGEDCVVLTVTDRQTAKVTDAAELPTKGRGTAGLRLTKFRDERAVDFAWVGPEAGATLIVGTEDAPSKPDANPQPLTIPHTGRDLVSKKIPRRILAVGFGRW